MNLFDIVLTPNKSVAIITEKSSMGSYSIDYISKAPYDNDNPNANYNAWWDEKDLQLVMDFGSYLKLLPLELQLVMNERKRK